MKIEISSSDYEPHSSLLSTADFGDYVSLVSLIVAIIAGIVAWLTWRTTNRHNANEHVHRLFSEYLKLRIDHNSSPPANERDDITNIASMKLYILEEMYNWVLIQSNLQQKLFGVLGGKMGRAINDNIDSWRRTIVVHVLQDFKETKKSIIDYACCYSMSFIKFVALETNDEDLLKLASVHDMALKSRQNRPLGFAEKSLLAAVSMPKPAIRNEN